MIVDAHLDLAFNVTRGRDVTQPAERQPVVDNEIATVGLPDLLEGRVGLVCATIFCEPRTSVFPGGYTTPDEAMAIASTQLQWYEQQFTARRLIPVRRAGEVPRQFDGRTHAILLLEGADAIRGLQDVHHFYDAGVRVVGLAWKRTAHAGGTGEPGGLSELGRQTATQLDELGFVHDASHLAEQAFWDLLELTAGPVIASHSNCRTLVPTDRQLSDEMIRAIASRGGVIGINFFHKFLLPPAELGTRPATFADVIAHVKHVCDVLGSARHVAIGTDLDGGLGRGQVPQEIHTIADLHKLADALHDGGFGDEDIHRILSENWIGFFAAHLPK
jgi:membrane dipeptidase